MIYTMLIGMLVFGGAVLYDSLSNSSAMLAKYEQVQRERLLKGEITLQKAIERYKEAFGMLPSSHMDLIASGFLSTNDTSMLDYKERAAAAKYQRALSRYVGSSARTTAELKALFAAVDYASLPLEIRNVVTSDEFTLISAAKIDYQVIDSKIVYSDEIAASTYDERVAANRVSGTLLADETIMSAKQSTLGAASSLTESQLAQAVITGTVDDVDKYKASLSSQNYTTEQIDSLMKIYEAKRDELNLY